MSLDPATERDRVHAKYAPFGRRDFLWWVVLFAVVFAASRFISVDWRASVALLISAVGWEITKFRLRRNADQFVEKQRRQTD